MIHHILEGDRLKDLFPSDDITGELIVCRESLSEGPVSTKQLPEFYAMRAAFFEDTFGKPRHDYYTDVVSELQLISTIPKGNEIRLWFSRDFSSQVNLWFICRLLKQQEHRGTIAIVFPVNDKLQQDRPTGKNDFLEAWEQKINIDEKELELFAGLWDAFQSRDADKMTAAAQELSPAFEFLPELVQNYVDSSW